MTLLRTNHRLRWPFASLGNPHRRRYDPLLRAVVLLILRAVLALELLFVLLAVGHDGAFEGPGSLL